MFIARQASRFFEADRAAIDGWDRTSMIATGKQAPSEAACPTQFGDLDPSSKSRKLSP